VAGYTVKNLKADVEDMAPKFGLGPDLEARFAREPLGCERCGVSYERLLPNARSPFGHRHTEQEEVYVVVGGSGRVRLEDEVLDLGHWDAVRVSPETRRAFEAGPDGLELIVFGAPSTGPGDAEILHGWWSE
jgi:mannose-6-phosphate isomerase-like protein (cupin superfamily)